MGQPIVTKASTAVCIRTSHRRPQGPLQLAREVAHRGRRLVKRDSMIVHYFNMIGVASIIDKILHRTISVTQQDNSSSSRQ